jgi:pimeloyl-ACP methyl ester carboxylesterase
MKISFALARDIFFALISPKNSAMSVKTKIVCLFLISLAFNSCKEEVKSVGIYKPGILYRDGAEIHYNVYGDGGATLLFVHGAYIDQTYWDAQVKYFKDDYKVVTMDLPGHGKSGKGRKYWSLDNFAGDVYAVVRRLDLKNVILIGHSMAGDINLIEVTSHPKNIIGFIGIDNFKQAATPMPRQFEQQRKAIEAALKKDFAGTNENFARTMLTSTQTDSTITNRVANDFKNAYEPMGAAITPELFDVYKRERRLLTKLRLKLHLINVSNTPTDEKPLQKYCSSGYDIRYIKGTSHYPMLENPDEFNRLLRQTIEDISRENDGASH